MSSIATTISAVSLAVVSIFTNTNTNSTFIQLNNEPTVSQEYIINDSTNTIETLGKPEDETLKVEPVATSEDSTMPYYVKVNISQNVVNVYKKDENGDYSIPEKVMLCSTGTYTPKPGKKFKITSYRRTWNSMQGGVYAQYAVQITGNILMHSVPYLKKNNSSLEYWEYDKLGEKASLGCIRLNTADAKWVYNNVWAGTTVEFYEDETPGPLGKPEGIKISDNVECRNWDPTDYIEGNPWYAEA